ncbi:ubiquinol-cytochrome C chaperone family protein [Parerythrobacter aurantius]|uniref:ubiquinol-cytochrome C chaperone family protein n=1 Tax=Parerythrobacter aurantius TaxID=3127706 RepID=UPI0032566421
MSLFSRLFTREPDPKEALRPLWHQLVKVARTRELYAECGVADTLDGRFDMLSTVLAVAMLRMEGNEATVPAAARLTELFVDDMDGQLRESGLGDPTVGKQLGKLVSALGGRCGALRDGLAEADDAVLIAAVERNVSFREGGSPACVAKKLRAFAASLDALDFEPLLAADLNL